ncbi:MAG: DNA repair and recombination protein RadA [Candidatus Methanomethylicota archaeon]|uniref:DNA repair and recombination protein RadA n=1 Tax=Thermoproteota archaeon TaxID=2056631 RepID=A0A497ERY5_9CREN|nr:MAG: DNA repair and recombination protein RadA [Candidatus Verstraetearchaeota archaeon]RLE49886.1 MAG: DNA repair and recombination protein RadA [Candidatus Verstraetearchaeota archaeon]
MRKVVKDELESLDGVGAVTAEKLRRGGITCLRDLAALSTRELLQRVEGISEERAFAITRAAREKLGVGIVPAKVYLRGNAAKLTTGCSGLDAILKGGLEKGITELVGAYGTGKTQLCFQLCVTVQLPKEKGGLGGGAFFIDTEDTFSSTRIVEIARRFGMGEEVLENIYHAKALNTDHQMDLVEEAFNYVKYNNVKLVVVDSLTAHFRSEYVGREALVARQQKLNRHIHQLQRLFMLYDIVVVVTNQILDVPEYVPGTANYKPAGGNIVAHGCTYRILLEKSKGLTKATIIDSPKHPRASTYFAVKDEGIVDAEQKP